MGSIIFLIQEALGFKFFLCAGNITMAGRFIAFEGIDKEVLSDQAERLAGWLRTEADVKSVMVTREPSNGPLGFQLRLALNKRISLHEYALSLLSVSDRMDNFFGTGKEEDSFIQKDLQNGAYVLSIGYLLSTFAYKSDIITIDWLMHINCFFPWPDLMIFINIPVDSVLTRIIKERGYDEADVRIKREQLMKLQSSYLEIIDILREQGRIIEIIESDSMDVIHRNCIKLANKITK
jgi:dTMP kinase